MSGYVDWLWVARNSDHQRNVGSNCARCGGWPGLIVFTSAGHVGDCCISDEYQAAALEVAEWFCFALTEWQPTCRFCHAVKEGVWCGICGGEHAACPDGCEQGGAA